MKVKSGKMFSIAPKFDKLLKYNSMAIIIVISFSFCQCHRGGDKKLTSQKLDHFFEKYMTAIKRLSDDFPNHQIELHLDIAGEDPQIPRKRVKYIHLREPAVLRVRSNGENKTEENQMSKSVSSPAIDPEMKPVLMKDLKNAIEELDRKYNGKIDTNNTPHKSGVDVNMKPILRLLEKGTLINSEIQKPPEENMSWLQIKIPK